MDAKVSAVLDSYHECITSVLLPVGTGIEVSRYDPV